MQFKVKGIISYPNLHQPRSVNPGDEPKFSTAILIHKNDPQIAEIQRIVDTEKANAFPNGFPVKGKCFIKDAAVEHPDQPQIKDYMVLNANAKADQKPALVDANLQPITNPADVFAGGVAWFSLNSFPFNKPVNQGIGCGLNGVMVTGEMGELGRLDGRPSVESMFGDMATGAAVPAPAAAQAAPAAAQAAPAPAPMAPPAAPMAQPQYVMTPAANGVTREAYHAAGWTDAQLVQNGLMQPPAASPSFG